MSSEHAVTSQVSQEGRKEGNFYQLKLIGFDENVFEAILPIHR